MAVFADGKLNRQLAPSLESTLADMLLVGSSDPTNAPGLTGEWPPAQEKENAALSTAAFIAATGGVWGEITDVGKQKELTGSPGYCTSYRKATPEEMALAKEVLNNLKGK